MMKKTNLILAILLVIAFSVFAIATTEDTSSGSELNPESSISVSSDSNDNSLSDKSADDGVDSEISYVEESKNEVSDEVENDTVLGEDFKAAMDSYEDFMNEYVEFMKEYKANPTDLGLIAQYAKIMGEYSEFCADFEKWEDEEMNTAETAYYLEVQSRVSKKLLEVAE